MCIRDRAKDLIFRIRDMGLAVVVIEHDMRFIFSLCDRVHCLVRGETLIEGSPQEVQSDHRVIEAYIGRPDEDEEELVAEAHAHEEAAHHGPTATTATEDRA